MTEAEFLIGILRNQYTLNNDGGGNDGWCRVNNYYLLKMLRIAETIEQERDHLAAQNAELIETMKWIHNHGGLGYSIHGALEKAIAKAGAV